MISIVSRNFTPIQTVAVPDTRVLAVYVAVSPVCRFGGELELVSARLLCMTLLHSLTYATSPS